MTGPLAGILVIDLSRALSGPHAAMMLGDLGARVIKVESPEFGDDTRAWGPPFVGPESARESTYFLSCNRNKESITLDLRNSADRVTLEKLVVEADVLIENFRPGVLDRLGFTTEFLSRLNPELVVLSISGFGHDGPEGDRPGYDQIAQGEAGLMSLTGGATDDPQRVGVPIGDLLAGMYGAFGVLAALTERVGSGRGQVVRTSLLAAVVGVHAFQGTRYTVSGEVGRAQGNHHPSIAPYGLFHSSDGLIQIAVGSDALWQALCGVVDLDPASTSFASNSERVRNRDALILELDSRFAAHTTNELLSSLRKAGVPAGIVRSIDEVYEWEQTRSQGLLVDVDHQTLGRITLPGPPLRYFTHSGDEVTHREHAAPPVLGQHDEAVRRWLTSRHQSVELA